MEIKCKEFVINFGQEITTKENKWVKGARSIIGNFTLTFDQNCPVTLGEELDTLSLINRYNYKTNISEKIIISNICMTDSETIVSFCNEFTPKFDTHEYIN
jgi:hypothetical protein